MLGSPQIECPELPAFETAAELNAARHEFRAAPVCKLQQAWRIEPEPGFAPAAVRVGWRNNALLLLAELNDADILHLRAIPTNGCGNWAIRLKFFCGCRVRRCVRSCRSPQTICGCNCILPALMA